MKLYPKIALMGASGSGKDYCLRQLCNYLDSKHLENYYKLSFSDQLKKCTKMIFPWINLDYPPEKKEKPLEICTSIGEKIDKSPREIWLNMNLLRNIEDSIFVRMLKDEMEMMEMMYQIDQFIISDLRTPPELEFCKENNFRIIRIQSDFKCHKIHEFDQQQEQFMSFIYGTFLNKKDKFDINEFLELLKD